MNVNGLAGSASERLRAHQAYPPGSQRTWRVLGPENYYRGVALAARARRPLLARRARHQARTLAGRDTEAAGRLAAMLRRVADDRLDAAEAAQLGRVEEGRRRVLRSQDWVPWASGELAPIAWVCARASQPPAGARILFHAVRAWRPARALEMGTCVGVSGAYQAIAQSDRPGCEFVSLEGYQALADAASGLWAEAGLTSARVVVGRFRDTLPRVLAGGPVDYAFIDGNHDGDATRGYVDQIAARAASGALLVLDDIDYSAGMRRAWFDVQRRADVAASADIGKLGFLALRS